ncbi:MAG: pyridoxamine 5'-phosphate oxidase [Acetobacteraceae bacterium]|nr:pyridoxamine 5'-phosphate oxidase [Acetobacteraceae bacterium]MCX7683638.1 pyridoxamine 5'-phosphate oxidase [Acetobacteraceae bacterium]MDW8397225.1 pyridoxamine 5'-phosphate oxidase [Acetobacteraceae bacterium]
MTDPFALFSDWFAEAEAAEPNDPNAMCLATATPDGAPSARMVLLKGLDPEGAPARGFVFYTNLESRKGREIAANPRAALLFHWKSLGRQVRIEGPLAPVAPEEADAYYASRPRLSRIGAWASRQSQPLGSRSELEAAVEAFDSRFPGEDIPRPSHWSGFRLTPERIEFWRERPFRLHERLLFTREGEGWRSGLLYP